MLTIKNARIIGDSKIIENMNIIIEDGKIIDITDKIPNGSETIDALGNFVSPGFIDIHIHGAGGADTMDGTYDSLNTISKVIAKHGVTSFIPTTMTLTASEIKSTIHSINNAIHNGTDGAQILGIHLEGPFINKKNCGAQNPDNVIAPDIDYLINLAGGNFSTIKRITIAPEVEGASELIRFIIGQGITASVGHSNGTYDEIMNSIGRGVSHSTHLYNAMKGFHHREPGVVGAILDSRITTEFIADGIHSHFAALRAAVSIKGVENCALITDSMRACCMRDGVYSLGGQQVFVKDAVARLSSGNLAGSTLTMDNAVRNIMKNSELGIIETVLMASHVPARISGVSSRKGSIKKGYDADITIFDPDINIKMTLVKGKLIYKA